MKDRQLFITSDGSHSIYIPSIDETYHSRHGAIQEAKHVFIKNGLHNCNLNTLSIMEIGFGTGLNCFITFLESLQLKKTINYTGIEAFPISVEESKKLNYVNQLEAAPYQEIFDKIHESNWEEIVFLNEQFSLIKKRKKIENITAVNLYNLIYFDAFGPRVQPELWTEDISQKMFQALKPKGILATYSAKGSVRRAMQKVGFTVEKLPGPPGKREMLRAIKP